MSGAPSTSASANILLTAVVTEQAIGEACRVAHQLPHRGGPVGVDQDRLTGIVIAFEHFQTGQFGHEFRDRIVPG